MNAYSQKQNMKILLGKQMEIKNMTQNTKRFCPICNSENKKLLFRQKFSPLSDGSLLTGYDVVVCESCGFCFADDIPEQNEFDSYYQEMSKYEYQDTQGKESNFDEDRFKVIAKFISPFIPKSQSRILDIGCATGGLLSILKNKGYNNLFGLDPSPFCAKFAQKLYNIPVFTHNLWNFPLPSQPFDCIILSGVLEHIRNLNLALDKMSSLLSPEGILFIEVPDASRFMDCQDAPFQQFSNEHIDFFSSTSLNNLLAINGWKNIICEQNNHAQSDTTIMPVITAIYQKELNSKEANLIKDTETMNKLTQYIEICQSIDSKINQIINNLVETQIPLIIWGVGTHTQRLLATSKLAEANISAFVDSNPKYHQKQLHGKSIISPLDLTEYSESILISSRVFQENIKIQIRDILKLENYLIVLY